MTSTAVSGYTTKSGKQVKGYTQSRNGTGKPKPTPNQRTRRAVGGSVAGAGFLGSVSNFGASGFNFGSSIFNLGTAVLTVAGMSVMAWGTHRYVKKRKARKGTTQLGTPRAATRRRVQSPAIVRAKAQAKLEKKKLRHELHKDWVASLFGPSRVTKSDWSQVS